MASFLKQLTRRAVLESLHDDPALTAATRARPARALDDLLDTAQAVTRTLHSVGVDPADPSPGGQLAGVIAALDHPTRRRIVATLRVRGTHMSQLARDLEVSRPVLHVHLARLQEAGLVTSSLRFSEDGKVLRHSESQHFDIRLTPDAISESVESPAQRPSPAEGRV